MGCSSTLSMLKLQFRKPGERLKAFPEQVWKQYDCGKKKLPFFAIEDLELSPRHLEPGDEFNQRLTYVLCPATASGVVTGRLDTRILYRGKPVINQRDSSYDIKPGRWVVDTFVRLPKNAGAGVYAFELKFRGAKLRFEKTLSFAVDAPKNPPKK
jgi:hypothetical protein